MASDKILMIAVLLTVLTIAIIGIYFTSNLTGMIAAEQEFAYLIADFIDIELTAGDGTNTSFKATITPSFVSAVSFDSFGNCTGCTDYSIDASPYDKEYAGLIGNNQTLCGVIRTDSNTQINLFAKLNNSLPSGFDTFEITSRSFHNVSTSGTQRFAFNSLTNSFDDANALELTTLNQQLLGNWSDGTGFGGVSEDISCKWTVDPYALPAGSYVILVSYTGST